jgi:aminoglycoside phosphotransferase (APT) family kinase protein
MPEISKMERSAEEFLQRIHAEFPQLQWQSYVHNTEGWDHDVLILDNKLVFRFPNDDEYAGRLQTEVGILRRLKPLTSVRIPDYQYVSADGSFAGYPLIPGKQLKNEYFRSLPHAQQQALASQMAGLLTAMHTAVARGHDFSDVPAAYMAEDQADVKRQSEEFLPSLLTPEDMEIVRRILAEVDVMLTQTHPIVFIHGDIYNNHILWDEAEGKLGIIDFSDMNHGDPAIDFADLHEYGPEFIREVYAQYQGPKDDTLLARAWTYQRWIGVYMMTDHFIFKKNTFKEAREIFDWVKQPGAATRPRPSA